MSSMQSYSYHLYGSLHKNAIYQTAQRHKAQVARIRVMQRRTQRDLEDAQADLDDEDEEFGDDSTLGASQFCQLCRLNYRTDPEEHKLSREHRQIKRLLKPSCRTCQVGFTSAMDYEVHRATIDHLQAEAAAEQSSDSKTLKRRTDSVNVNWGEFQTVDSIGDVDEADALLLEKNEPSAEGESAKATETAGESVVAEDAKQAVKSKGEKPEQPEEADATATVKASENAASPKKKTSSKAPGAKSSATVAEEPPNIGVEMIREIKVMYCDVCRTTLTQRTDPEVTLRNHCRWRTHIKLYNQHLEAVTRREARKRKQQQLDKAVAERKRRVDSSTAASKAAKASTTSAASAKTAAASTANTSKDESANDTTAESVNEKADEVPGETSADASQEDAADAADAAQLGVANDEGAAHTKEDDDEDDDDDNVDDKTWADVDKDLGDLLQAVNSENANDDEDEDSTANTER